MEEQEAIIERVKQVNNSVQHLELAIDDAWSRIKPGQSLLAWPANHPQDAYMRDHWWPVNIKPGNKLIIERPLSEVYEPPQVVHVLGLVGKPYRFRRTLRNVLLIAHDTLPTPLMMTIPWLLGNQISVTLALLGAAREYETSHLPPEVEIIQGNSEKFTWPDQVMTVGWADQVFVTVSNHDLGGHFRQVLHKFEELRAVIPKNYLFGVFDDLLPCGAGACQACMVPTREGDQLSCTEGPAFDLTQVHLA